MSSLGHKLKELREKNGKTQEDMSKLLNVGRVSYTLYENDKRMPTLDTLKRLSEIFNVTTDYLLGNDHSSKYYFDPETARLAQEIHDNPQYKVLFDATKHLKPESVKEVMRFIDYQKSKEGGE